MATLTVRNVPEWVVDALKARARRQDRSMEAEVRQLLEEQMKSERVDFFSGWMDRCVELRTMPGPELELPVREPAREFTFDE